MKFILSVGFLALLGALVSATPGPECKKIHFVQRSEWGARTSMNHTRLHLPIHHVFIHHTDMALCTVQADCAKEMRNIYDLHTSPPREWGDIGYNFLIGGDGAAYVGRNWNAVGAHTLGMNAASVAFSLMGDYMKSLPTKNMLETVHQMIKCGIEEGVISPNYKLHGHRDQSCTDCPGDELYHHIKSWPHFAPGPLETYVCKNP